MCSELMDRKGGDLDVHRVNVVQRQGEGFGIRPVCVWAEDPLLLFIGCDITFLSSFFSP